MACTWHSKRVLWDALSLTLIQIAISITIRFELTLVRFEPTLVLVACTCPSEGVVWDALSLTDPM